MADSGQDRDAAEDGNSVAFFCSDHRTIYRSMIEENNLVSLNQYNSSQSSQSQPDPSQFDYEPDPLEVYAAMYDPDFELGESVRTPRNPKARASDKESVADLTDVAEGLEAGFEITYRPARSRPCGFWPPCAHSTTRP